MSVISIACIVEGHGEVEAVPILLRRIGATVDPGMHLVIKNPIRVSRTKLVKDGEIERTVQLAAAKTGGSGGVLVLVDADDDCPAKLAPKLLRRARAARSDVPIAVVLAEREFEAWFLVAAASLAGKRGLRMDLAPPPNAETRRNAKGWLTEQRVDGNVYSETTDQAALAQLFDLREARRARSFDKCFRDVVRLIRELSGS